MSGNEYWDVFKETGEPMLWLMMHASEAGKATAEKEASAPCAQEGARMES